jgi:N-acetylmuramoyl-L-alanine amidase
MRVLIFTVMMVLSNSAWGEFKPLTRAEPIVRMVLQEAANEPFAGLVAVAGVALDRIQDDRWPNTARDVVYSPAQFTGMGITLRRYSRVQITRARLAVVEAYLGTRPCGTVLWYHTTEVTPSWRERLVLKCQLGVHIFYGDQQ